MPQSSASKPGRLVECASKRCSEASASSSILLIMSVGLAIVFGLMGVINMAHGELMMVGAYATYMAQEILRASCLPAMFDYYFVVAMPMAFLVAAGCGMLLEATVIRFLYGRPLETMLATWGVSLVIMQARQGIFWRFDCRRCAGLAQRRTASDGGGVSAQQPTVHHPAVGDLRPDIYAMLFRPDLAFACARSPKTAT